MFGDVDSALAVHGLATVGGLYNQTGVGGLILRTLAGTQPEPGEMPIVSSS